MKIVNWKMLDIDKQQALIKRPAVSNADLRDAVIAIIEAVKRDDDEALFNFTQQYDGAILDTLLVSEEEFERAKQDVVGETLESIKMAIARIENYQRQCMPTTITVDTQDGIVCKRIPKPIARVGLYVPGGSAPLVSTVMMLAIPAAIAGSTTRVLCTPPRRDGSIDPRLLVTARLCGIDSVYKVGGAQAIASMAYGTKSISKVDKIFGPGNAWVTEAKLCVSQDPIGAAIDLPAGPSEVLVIADELANPQFVASDLLSQAEHGVDSQVILITNSSALADQVLTCLNQQLLKLTRQPIAEKALKNSTVILVDEIVEAFPISDQYAPEHLILQLKNADDYLSQVNYAGAVFVGQWAPETVGDYVTGSNHVLPTYGYANRESGLSVADFMRYMSVQNVSEQGLAAIGKVAMNLAEMEGLDAHRNAVALRMSALEVLQ